MTTLEHFKVTDQGAEQAEELRIIHRTHANGRFTFQALPTLNRFVENNRMDDNIKDTVYRAMQKRVGFIISDVLVWFESKPFTRKEITAAYDTGKSEGEDVSTLWGMIQGLTAHARELPHIDAESIWRDALGHYWFKD